ncbi:MAG: OmpA family protein [Pseudomonadota bacterium]
MTLQRFTSIAGGIALAVGLTVGAAGTSFAEEKKAYSVSDVVQHFSQSANLGKTRALCIGTPSECGQQEPEVAATPFNLHVQFEFNSADLTPEAREQLDVFVEAATGALSRAAFNIDGHTDASGAEVVNQQLSEARAAAVKNYLVDRGVSPERLNAAGHGEAKPAHDDPFHFGNRRVEASLADVR